MSALPEAGVGGRSAQIVQCVHYLVCLWVSDSGMK